MNLKLTALIGLSVLGLASTAGAQITFYEGEGFRGRAFTSSRQVRNFQRAGFNNRASSVIVGRGLWEVCDGQRFQGTCVFLRVGSYDSLRRMGMNDRVSSMREVDNRRRRAWDNRGPEPLDAPNYDYRRRPNQRVYEARVTSVHAVLGPPEQNCWVERSQVHSGHNDDKNVGGAIVGAILGGVLGHQVGGGHTQDAAGRWRGGRRDHRFERRPGRVSWSHGSSLRDRAPGSARLLGSDLPAQPHRTARSDELCAGRDHLRESQRRTASVTKSPDKQPLRRLF